MKHRIGVWPVILTILLPFGEQRVVDDGSGVWRRGFAHWRRRADALAQWLVLLKSSLARHRNSCLIRLLDAPRYRVRVGINHVLTRPDLLLFCDDRPARKDARVSRNHAAVRIVTDLAELAAEHGRMNIVRRPNRSRLRIRTDPVHLASGLRDVGACSVVFDAR